MAICEDLGGILNQIRITKGQSITRFSEELEISRSALQGILNGTGNPRSDTIEHIARHLQMDYRTLLSGPGVSTPLHLTAQQETDLLHLLERFSHGQEDPHE